jgi:hypothetical protein
MSDQYQAQAMKLEELKRRLDRGTPVTVDQYGTLRTPGDPEVAALSSDEKTLVKPSRWYGSAG